MKILLPLDGSDTAEQAIPYVKTLARHWEAQVIVLRTVGPEVVEPSGALASIVLRLRQQEDQFADEYLEQIKAEFAGQPVETLKTVGSPRVLVDEVARDRECDLIVMASHGRGGFQRWLLGSVAETVLRKAPCPVLLVRGEASAPVPFERVLVPLDGSELSVSVLQRLGPFLKQGAHLRLLRVADLSERDLYFVSDPSRLEAALAELEQELEPITLPGVTLDREVLQGDPRQVILHQAEALKCDLIAMSTHGRGGWKHLLLGSVTESVARRAPCPVLAFPPLSET